MVVSSQHMPQDDLIKVRHSGAQQVQVRPMISCDSLSIVWASISSQSEAREESYWPMRRCEPVRLLVTGECVAPLILRLWGICEEAPTVRHEPHETCGTLLWSPASANQRPRRGDSDQWEEGLVTPLWSPSSHPSRHCAPRVIHCDTDKPLSSQHSSNTGYDLTCHMSL